MRALARSAKPMSLRYILHAMEVRGTYFNLTQLSGEVVRLLMFWGVQDERHSYEKCQYIEFKRRVAKMDELKAEKGGRSGLN